MIEVFGSPNYTGWLVHKTTDKKKFPIFLVFPIDSSAEINEWSLANDWRRKTSKIIPSFVQSGKLLVVV